MKHRQKAILERLGIVRSAIREDLLFFFFPFLTAFYLELWFCAVYGDGLSGIWRLLWELLKQPQNLFLLPWRRSMGLILFAIGLMIMIVGQVTLRHNYSGFVVIKKGHQLITHGIYCYTRNPIYLGALLVFISLPVYARSWHGALTMLILIPILLNRIRLEERLLTAEFADAYQEYREHTKKLIPFVY